MKLTHECGGTVVIDRSSRVEIVSQGDTTDLFYPCRCNGCGETLGFLANVRLELDGFDEKRRPFAY